MQYIQIFNEHLKAMKRMGDAQIAMLMRCLIQFSEDGEKVYSDDPMVDMLLDLIYEKLDLAQAAYDKKCELQRERVNKRWNKNADAETGNEEDTTVSTPDTAVYHGNNQTKPNQTKVPKGTKERV